ncbi:tRNA pseudouridine(55) synthase TruB [uncultured Ligilactobacillus sp.]|uniref:tRNA pseudouridine(55) synthase TruB n=1 Tax=uncultured Ligilactobacillus sp. TaxID=2837633 RepID=UPI00351DA85F
MGILIINKPKGYTSHDVVAKVKKILNIKKVGHTGTLDPNATGVLPLLLNDSTKLSKYLIEHDKEYEVTLKLGIKTDTADIEGNILEEKQVQNISIEQIEETLKSFEGKQEQYPPMYSAIKVNGKKLYEYARNGEKVEIKPRNIEIYRINLINFNDKESEIQFKVICSKGTYIRSLCEDIAKKLNTIGYMKELNRTKVGRFKIEDAITLEELENSKEQKIIAMENLLSNLPNINLNEKQLEKFLNGVQISVDKEDGIYNIYTNKYLGTGIVKNRKIKRDIILK